VVETAAEQAQELVQRASEQARDLLTSAGDDATDEAQEQAEDTADQAEGAADDAQEQAEGAADEAEDAGDEAREQAEDTADQAEGAAGDAGDDAQDEAQEQAEDTADQAEGAADDAQDEAEGAADEGPSLDPDDDEYVTRDRLQSRDRGEYRVEDDEREEIEPVVDLEVGPVAVDLLGLEVHLDRLHAAIVANAGPDHALIGKLLAQLAKGLEKAGLGKLVGLLTTAVEKALSVLPSPKGDGTDDAPADEDGGDEDGGSEDDGRGLASSIFHKLTAPIRAAINLIKKLTGNAGSAAGAAAGDAVDAAKHVGEAVRPSSGTTQRLRHGKAALDDVRDIGEEAKEAVTGSS
jgi:hypothetical protein